MACPWWDDDDYKHVGGSSFGDQKSKSHEKKGKSQNHTDHNKGKSHEKGKKNHEGKMKEQNLPKRSYEHGYESGYVKGYGDGYESGYEQGCVNTRDTKFGDGYTGTQASGKKREYHGYCTSGYIVKRREVSVEYHHGYELDNDHRSDNQEYGYNDHVAGYVAGYESHNFQSGYGGWNDNYDSDY